MYSIKDRHPEDLIRLNIHKNKYLNNLTISERTHEYIVYKGLCYFCLQPMEKKFIFKTPDEAPRKIDTTGMTELEAELATTFELVRTRKYRYFDSHLIHEECMVFYFSKPYKEEFLDMVIAAHDEYLLDKYEEHRKMDEEEREIASKVPEAFHQAYLNALAEGLSVMIAEDGYVVEVFPDGTKKRVKPIENEYRLSLRITREALLLLLGLDDEDISTEGIHVSSNDDGIIVNIATPTPKEITWLSDLTKCRTYLTPENCPRREYHVGTSIIKNLLPFRILKEIRKDV